MKRLIAAALLFASLVWRVQAQVPSAFTLTRDLRLDPATADLSSVEVMIVSRSGEILVTQGKDRIVRWFSPGGTTGSMGKGGEGPGEFNLPRRIGFLGDSIWVLDPRLKRLSVFSPDHRFVRSSPSLTTVKLQTSDRATPGLEIFEQVVFADGSLRVRVSFPSKSVRPKWAGNVGPGSSLLVRVTPDGVLKSRIAALPESPCMVNFTFGHNGSGSTITPFCFEPVSSEWDASTLVARASAEPGSGKESRYRVTLIDESGKTLFSRAYAFIPRSVSKAAVDSSNALLERMLKGAPPAYLAARPKIPPAKTWPPLRRIVVGRDRTVWLELDSPSTTHTWLVLDTLGTPVGTATLPREVRLLVADLQNIWGLETDPDELLGIVRYKIGRAH